MSDCKCMAVTDRNVNKLMDALSEFRHTSLELNVLFKPQWRDDYTTVTECIAGRSKPRNLSIAVAAAPDMEEAS